MYCAFYGFSEKPFNITPDPKYLFFGSTHKEAFAHLLYGIRERGGFVAITGEIGTGKTTLCRALLEYMDKDTLVAFIFNPTLSALELLKTINEDFGIPSKGSTKKELIDELNHFLLVKRQEGKNTILIIDEAQDLDPEVLEHIRLLSNLETNTEKLLQIILIGQPELRQVLEQPRLRQLNQRITVRYHLKPLSQGECEEYIQHRLTVAGAQDKVVFKKEALKKIYHFSRGIPRLVNVLCDRALLAGYTLGSKELYGKIIDRARKEVFGEREITQRTLPAGGFWNAFLSGLGLAVLIVLAWYGGYLFLYSHNPAPVAKKETKNNEPRFPLVARPGLVSPTTLSPEQGPSFSVNAVEQSQPPPHVHVNVSSPQVTQPAPPPAVETASLKAVFKESFGKKTIMETKKASVEALIKTWTKIPSQKISILESDALDVYQASEAFDLNCSYFAGSINLLKALNLPAMLVLNFGGSVGKRYVCLLEIVGEEVRIAPSMNDGMDKVSISILTEFWYGSAYLFWKDFKMEGEFLLKGMHGGEVSWLQDSLKRIGYYDGEMTGVYDARTEKAVQSFQKAHYLEEDGVLGPQTKIVLYHALKVYPMPTLISQEVKAEGLSGEKGGQEPKGK